MSITIRELAPGDRVQWEALFRAYIRFYREKVPDEVIEATWQRVLAQQDGFVGLVAEEPDGRLVGIAHLLFHRSTWSPTFYCYLEDLFVDIDTRRHGVGRALIEATYREADKRGATRTYWTTMGDNMTARRLYDRLAKLSGFVQYRR
jgi:GNAT superfamily N-acetyltransferase